MIYIDVKPVPDSGSCTGSSHPQAAGRHHGTLDDDDNDDYGDDDDDDRNVNQPTKTIPV